MFGRITTVALAAVLLAGCQNGGGMGGGDDSRARTAAGELSEDRARLVAFAATSEYPQSKASDDLRTMAVVNRAKDQITIYNASDRTLRDARLWVNGKFAGRVEEIAARGAARVSTGDLYDRMGLSLRKVEQPITQVQLHLQDGAFYNLEGPVFE